MLLGNWKNFAELEESICMQELVEIVLAKSDYENEQRKFFAAIQGIDLEEGSSSSADAPPSFEDIKARVFSGGQATSANDILSLQGINAQQAGFGIGLGLEYTDAKSLEFTPSW
jgi:hypothetical protein